jgi:hypothetical protein
MNKKYQKMHVLFEDSASTLSINLHTMKVENWLFKHAVYTNYKTADCCIIQFETVDGQFCYYRGYVPDFFPKQGGDYVELDIDKNGFIPKWKVSDRQIDKALKEYKLHYNPSDDE